MNNTKEIVYVLKALKKDIKSIKEGRKAVTSLVETSNMIQGYINLSFIMSENADSKCYSLVQIQHKVYSYIKGETDDLGELEEWCEKELQKSL